MTAERGSRLEAFGAIVQMARPRALVFVDRDRARHLGVTPAAGDPAWRDPTAERVREAIVLPTAPGEPTQLATASRNGHLSILTLAKAGRTLGQGVGEGDAGRAAAPRVGRAEVLDGGRAGPPRAPQEAAPLGRGEGDDRPGQRAHGRISRSTGSPSRPRS